MSSLWYDVYLPARESRQVPMCRRGTLSRYSYASGSTIPQPMPLPQVPIGVLCLSNVCLLSRIYSGIPCLPATCLALRFRPQVFLAFLPPVLLLPVVWQISLAFIPYTLPSTQKIALKSDFSCTIQNISLPLQPIR